MAYTPTNWKTGETITADRLNHAEQGIADAFSPYVVTFKTTDGQTATCDRTYQQIADARENGVVIGVLDSFGFPMLLPDFSTGTGSDMFQFAFMRCGLNTDGSIGRVETMLLTIDKNNAVTFAFKAKALQ